MKDSIAQYMDSHKKIEKPLSNDWVKTTFAQGEPSLLGHRIDVCLYTNKALGLKFGFYSEEDKLDIDFEFEEKTLPYAEAEKLRAAIEDALKKKRPGVVVLDSLPRIETFNSMSLVVLNGKNSPRALLLADPDHSYYRDICESGDNDESKLFLAQILRAGQEKNMEFIKKVIHDLTEIPSPEDFECVLSKSNEGNYSLSTENIRSSFSIIKNIISSVIGVKPLYNTPDEVSRDMYGYVDARKEYYLVRRKELLDNIRKESVKVTAHFSDIVNTPDELPQDQVYSLGFIKDLAAWYRSVACLDPYICIVEAFAMDKKDTQKRRCAKEWMDEIIILSKRNMPPTERLKYLPFFCSITIVNACENNDNALKVYAIELLNELAGGDDFKIPYDLNKFEEEYKCQTIVTLAEKLGNERRKSTVHQSPANTASGSAVIEDQRRFENNEERDGLLRQHTTECLTFLRAKMTAASRKVAAATEHCRVS